MKESEKKGIFILIIISIIIIGIITIYTLVRNKNIPSSEDVVDTSKVKEEYVEMLNDGTKLNTSSKLSKEKKLGDLKITNIQLTNKNGISVLLADVENTGSIATEEKLVSISMVDNEGKEIKKLTGLIVALEPGAKTQLNVQVTSDYSNVYDFVIEEKK